MGLFGNPGECIGNDGIPQESMWVSIGRNFPQGDTQKSVWNKIQCTGTHKGHGGLQKKPYGTVQDEILFAKFHKGNRVGRWVNFTYTGWRCTRVVQHVNKLPTWSPMMEIIWHCMSSNLPHRNPQGRPCGRYGWIKFYTGSHVGYVTFP